MPKNKKRQNAGFLIVKITMDSGVKIRRQRYLNLSEPKDIPIEIRPDSP
jgi:hypothetical protein